MERKPIFRENFSFNWCEYFIGDWDLFQKILQNPETIFVYDMDGILEYTAEKVLKKFSDENGIPTNPAEINGWGYLTSLAKTVGLSRERVKHAEDYWYDPQLLLTVRRNLYIKPVVIKTVDHFGAKRNYVLTSRDPKFKDVTLDRLTHEFPEIPTENIMIRDDKNMDPAEFKSGCLWWLAKTAPWVVFVDDATDFIKSALDSNIDNLITVNIPQGKVMPDFSHGHLFIIKRYPVEYQAMLPFMYAVFKAIDSRST
jgi:hypothetical protein